MIYLTLLTGCLIDNEVQQVELSDDSSPKGGGGGGSTTGASVSPCSAVGAALDIKSDVCPEGDDSCTTDVETRRKSIEDSVVELAGNNLTFDDMTDPLNCEIKLTLWNKYHQTSCSDFGQMAVTFGDNKNVIQKWADRQRDCPSCIDEDFPVPFLYASAWQMTDYCHSGDLDSAINAVYPDPEDYSYDSDESLQNRASIYDHNRDIEINGTEYQSEADAPYSTEKAADEIIEVSSNILDFSAMLAANQSQECEEESCLYYGIITLEGSE